MPNGADKFWIRTASAIWRFRERYGNYRGKKKDAEADQPAS